MKRILALIIALLVTAHAADAAVAHVGDSASSGTKATGTSIVFTSVATSGSNPTFAVGITLTDATATVSSVVLSAGLTGTVVEVKNARDTANGGGQFTTVFCIVAPSGTGTITGTLSASVPWQATWTLFSGADQTTPCPTGDAVTNVNTGASPYTLTPSNLTANDATYAIGADDNGDVSGVTPNQSYLDDTTSNNMEAGWNTGTSGVTLAYSSDNHNMAKVAVRIAAAGAGGGATTTTSRLLTGVGK